MTTAVMNEDAPGKRAPLVLGHSDFYAVTETVAGIVEKKTTPGWVVLFGLAVSVLLILLGSLGKLVAEGIGIWGLNNTVFWAWDITGFVFWIGIGHAGTLISAILFLFRQKWRTSINRAAEAMTIFAVMAAAIYPVFHVGRVWFAYWLFPDTESNEHVAELQEPAALGRLRDFDVRNGVDSLLVRWSRTGSRDIA
jgi:molybdopterin-containing oxidoreductase family membrane subunit